MIEKKIAVRQFIVLSEILYRVNPLQHLTLVFRKLYGGFVLSNVGDFNLPSNNQIAVGDGSFDKLHSLSNEYHALL